MAFEIRYYNANLQQRQYRIRHWIPIFIGTPCSYSTCSEDDILLLILNDNWISYFPFLQFQSTIICYFATPAIPLELISSVKLIFHGWKGRSGIIEIIRKSWNNYTRSCRELIKICKPSRIFAYTRTLILKYDILKID